MSAQDPTQGGGGRRSGLTIKLDEPVAQGTYANLVMVQHSETEFVLDFIFLQPGQQAGKVGARVILGPRQAKRLMGAVADNVTRYEQRFGTIPVPLRPDPKTPVQ